MKLFLPQKTLEDWAIADEADLVEGKVVITATKSTHGVNPAVHFTKLANGTDSNNLIGRVKTVEQLDALGAEHMMDSVILGETVYEVVPGYIAEVKPAAPPPSKQDKKKASSPEADLLAAFILDKL